MKKKLIATLIALAMVVSLIPMIVFSADDEEPGETSNLTVTKKVLLEDGAMDAAFWLTFNDDFELLNADVLRILGGLTFYIYKTNADGDPAEEVEGVTGKIVPGTSEISFYDEDGDPYMFETGWYLITEEIGEDAEDYFVDVGASLLVFFNELTGNVSSTGGAVFTDDTYFTVQQYKDAFRNVQALFIDEYDVIRSAITAPAIDGDPPLNGGGALGTSRFVATQDTGEVFMSFCADIGALLVQGKYYLDEEDHGLSQQQMLRLIAAIDFIYARGGFAEFDDLALAQLVVWNLILQYTDDDMVAHRWLKSTNPKVFMSEVWGELFKIEGITTYNGVTYWYIEEYRELIDDIIAHADDDTYVDIYKERIEDGAESFVNGAYFLKGRGQQPDVMQQRQLIIEFGHPVTFDNEPGKGKVYADLSIEKVVLEDGQRTVISAWLFVNKGLTQTQIEAILDDISFYVYKSNIDGDKLDKVDGVTGKIDYDTSRILFMNADNTTYKPDTGWYLIEEEMGTLAAQYFNASIADLHIYFNSNSGAVTPGASPVFPDDATFTIEQFDGPSRPVRGIYEDEDGVQHYVYTTPSLGDPGIPSGQALSTSRFAAKQDDGSVFMSFCADIGAVHSKGDYLIDKTNHDLTTEQMLRLVAAIDFLYARSEFVDYEDIALAQLVIWNYLLHYCDYPISADLWLFGPGVLLKDAWGDLLKIEGVTELNLIEYWYVQEYRDLIDDMIANADTNKYVNIYTARIAAGAEKFVDKAFFLVGDGGNENEELKPYEQQSQLLITFKGPVTFDNEPQEDVHGRIAIMKRVDAEREISVWLLLEQVLEPSEIEAILDNISFDLYKSNPAGEKLDQVVGVTGKIDLDTSMIGFLIEEDGDLVAYEASTGWYLVSENMGALAKAYFEDGMPDLHFYFDGASAVSGPDGNRVFFDNESKQQGGLIISARATLETSVGEYVEYWQGERTPYKYYKSSSEGSVTATNDYTKPTIVGNSNHFCYAILDRAKLVEGITLDMVVGNKINKVGTASVQLVDGKIVITFNDCESTSFGAVASNAPFNVSNGNVHSGNNNYGFKHNNVSSIACPAGDTIYLYIHGDFKILTDISSTKPGYDPATGYVWVEKAPKLIRTEYGDEDVAFTTESLDVFVTVFDADGVKVGEFTLNGEDADGGVATLNGLAPGVYTVKWEFDYAPDTTVYTGTVEVKAGETATFVPPITGSYTENTVWTEADDSPVLLPPIINPVVTVK